MGTRADFYVGQGPTAEWLGSTAWDGYPDGVFRLDGARPNPDEFIQTDAITDEASWRAAIAKRLDERDDGTVPADGWPWPWSDSGTTDYVYTFVDGAIHVSNGCKYITLAEYTRQVAEQDRLEKLAGEGDEAAADALDEDWWRNLGPREAFPGHDRAQARHVG